MELLRRQPVKKNRYPRAQDYVKQIIKQSCISECRVSQLYNYICQRPETTGILRGYEIGKRETAPRKTELDPIIRAKIVQRAANIENQSQDSNCQIFDLKLSPGCDTVMENKRDQTERFFNEENNNKDR